MNKYYANKEMAYPFDVINRLEYEKEDIEQRNFLDDLFKSLLLEIDGRMIGANLLCEMSIGDVLDSSCVESEDEHILDYSLIIDGRVLLMAKKRLDALKTFYDAINKAYQETNVNASGDASG